MEANVEVLNYVPSPTGEKFHRSNAPVRGVRGPVGSGKSVMCVMEVLSRAQEQASDNRPVAYKGAMYSGTRRSKAAIIRNTYPELIETTIATWKMWFPESSFGAMRKSTPIEHHLYFPLQDGTLVDCLVLFLSADKQQDVKKLMSLEITYGWINEARYVPVDILHALIDRVGRYPAKRDGGPTWHGVWMDTNSMDEYHWWAAYCGIRPMPKSWTKPTGWKFFDQPPGLFESRDENGELHYVANPDAENIENLPRNYYTEKMVGKPKSYIRVMYCNKYGSATSGHGVYEDEFNEDLHVAKKSIAPLPGIPIVVGVDSSGLWPAAVFSQKVQGQWRDLREVCASGMGAVRFADELKEMVAQLKSIEPHLEPVFWGDPAGSARSQTDERTYFEVLRSKGLMIKPAPSQNTVDRIEAGRAPMLRMVFGGRPGYLVSPECKMLIAGFNGEYKYADKPDKMTQWDVKDQPEKNQFSHVHEARQYGMLGGGEWAEMRGGRKKLRTTMAKMRGVSLYD